MKYCNNQGKQDKAAACGTYSACKACQYRFFYLCVMRDMFGENLVLPQDEQDWLDNVYSKLTGNDLRYVKAKYAPEATPTAYRKKEA